LATAHLQRSASSLRETIFTRPSFTPLFFFYFIIAAPFLVLMVEFGPLFLPQFLANPSKYNRAALLLSSILSTGAAHRERLLAVDDDQKNKSSQRP
jgi:hypothetical protein